MSFDFNQQLFQMELLFAILFTCGREHAACVAAPEKCWTVYEWNTRVLWIGRNPGANHVCTLIHVWWKSAAPIVDIRDCVISPRDLVAFSEKS